jgi:uncharacterized membrane protein
MAGWLGWWVRASPWLLAGLLAVSGTLHFTATRSYERIIPPALPYPRALVYGSGVAELACAAGLAHPRTRRVAAWASAVLFVAVFPANVQMAVAASGASLGRRLLTWVRLPLQVPLVWWAVQVARRRV